MNNKELFQRVKDLNLSAGQYAIFGSGPMGVRGIREIHDIDIIAMPDLYEQYANKPGWELRTIEGLSGVKNKELAIEIWKDWWPGWDVPQIIREAEIIDELPFVRLDKVIEWKKEIGREKDLEDLKLIDNWKNNEKI